MKSFFKYKFFTAVFILILYLVLTIRRQINDNPVINITFMALFVKQVLTEKYLLPSYWPEPFLLFHFKI